RRFLALSRHQATPRHLLLELNAAGTDYLGVDEIHNDGFPQNWDVLRTVLEDATQKLTRFEILDEWPADFDKPHPSTLSKWLDRAVQADLIAREGTGRKADPFLYWLPARETVWKQDPLYELYEKQKQDLKLLFGP